LKDFKDKSSLKERKPAINDLSVAKEGDYYRGIAKILRKSVPGPVIFSLFDGKKAIDGVIKSSDFKAGDIVDVEGFINSRAESFQLEIQNKKEAPLILKK
jgi:RecJ-like exonuclease